MREYLQLGGSVGSRACVCKYGKDKSRGLSLFGIGRSFISIDIQNCGNSYYSPTDDKIVICNTDIWDDFGIFTQAHEYGHAFHEKALGGNTGGTSFEGSLIEAAYAAFLYDLTDNVSEVRDSISAPGSYVGDLIRTCQARYVNWIRANGPDLIAYCAENAINPATYFTTRVPPSSYLESASESGGWSGTRVHDNWTWNMYEKR